MTRLLRVGLSVTLATLLFSGCGFVSKLKARDRLNKGVAAYKDEDYPEAVKKFKESIELDPQFANAWLYLATAYRQLYVPGSQTEEHRENARKAVETYQKVLELDPRNLNAIASIAGIYNDMGEHEKAKDWYRKRLEIEPNNPEPLYG
ncbi:MAG: tetratricopeptide repeat protein, partial [Acidobacteria bacterium]|nr:tetratricopeptide repeat protein [Acidobacteriota bacterium]